MLEGSVWRRETQLRAGGFDGVAHGNGFVRAQIVHDDDISGRQRRHQHLLHIGQESGAVHRPVEHHGRGHPLETERADEGGGLPMPVGHRRPAALAAPRPAVAPRHLGRGPGFIDEDQPLGFEIGLSLEPVLPTTHNVRALLLAGVRGFF